MVLMRVLRIDDCIILSFLLALFLASCGRKNDEQQKIQVAFLADVHLQDVQGQFEDADYRGILNKATGNYNTIRTMDAQLHSTRLFNENYFAFLTALNDLVTKNIKLVVLPGDFSDDGQPINIKALKQILDDYSQKYGMQFFLTTGNHDPVRPFTIAGGKYDFLGIGGRKQAIVSDSSLIRNNSEELTTIVTKQIKKWGYKEIANELSDFGFYPKEGYLYWETPTSTYEYKTYTIEKALKVSSLERRMYKMPNSSIAIPDMSYLVEPVEGLWLLAIDGNVYLPKKHIFSENQDSVEFLSASVGYNNVLTHKKHLVSWVKKVAGKAKSNGKTLVAFSHYPMVEFNDGASREIKSLFGHDTMQAHRVPEDIVSETFADAGIQIHFGGHIHMNDTGVFTSKKGNTLFNIQVPSLAAYIPGYKILTINSARELEIETKVLEEVTGFDTFFPLYKKEYDYLKKTGQSLLWNKEILSSKNYKTYTGKHLEGLIKSRFIPNDWPKPFIEKLTLKTGKELLLSVKAQDMDALQKELDKAGLTLTDFEQWTGVDMIYDFYRLRSADKLAVLDIGKQTLKQYIFLCSILKKSENDEMVLWANLFYKSYNGAPCINFIIDLDSSTIRNLSNN